MTENLCVILADQLSKDISSLKNFRKDKDKILMMEVANEARYVNHHKKKLVLVFTFDACEFLQTVGRSWDDTANRYPPKSDRTGTPHCRFPDHTPQRHPGFRGAPQ